MMYAKIVISFSKRMRVYLGKPYHLGKKIQDVVVRLMKMKSTNDMTRMPRKLEANLSHLKVS